MTRKAEKKARQPRIWGMLAVVLAASGALAAGGALAAPSVLTGIGDVRLKGFLGERLDTRIDRHVIATDVDYITAPFLEKTETKRWWQTEFWGKWMHAAVPYLAYTKSEKLKASVEHGIDRILSSQ